MTSRNSTKAARARGAPSTPVSWQLKTWPSDVWPHDPKRAQWLSQAYRTELVAARAMSRVGKTLVFSGVEYGLWLLSRSHHVVDFHSNNPTLRRGVRSRDASRAVDDPPTEIA